MKLIAISKDGVTVPKPSMIDGPNGPYWAVHHGDQGRGRWQCRFPLPSRYFPCLPDVPRPDLKREHLELKALGRFDGRNQPLFMLPRGAEDNRFLVFFRLSPGYRGGATYEVTGDASVVCEGREGQGDAGRMGGAPCPVILAEGGPCTVTWERTGRLYGEPSGWVAHYPGHGQRWIVGTTDDIAMASAAA